MHPYVALTVFAVIFFAELPDKSQLATLALSTRFRKYPVWIGAAAAFFVHVTIAVVAGKALTLLSHTTVDTIVGVLFVVGAALLIFSSLGEISSSPEGETPTSKKVHDNFGKAFVTSFVIVFLGEWGDITQIATANYVAKYRDPLSVGIGALAALWVAAGLSVTVGAQLLKHVPAKILRWTIALIMVISACFSFAEALR